MYEPEVANNTRMKPPPLQRIHSIDIIRGAVMVLMAIDHVRVYSGLPPGGPDPAIFFTRWVTHFCAPVFVFLAGTSAFLHGMRFQNKNPLARYLLVRGLILILLELTIIRFFWTFNVNLQDFTLAGVIWMLGWSMIVLAPFVYLKPLVVGILGLAIITLQNLFAMVPNMVPISAKQSFGYVWEFVYTSGLDAWPGITILYVLVPWIGVMMAGFGFGSILLLPANKRRKICLGIGVLSIALFIVLGSWTILGKSASPGDAPFLFQLLNQRKYPASQLYLLMTLGPAILLVPLVEQAKGWLASTLELFGKVPMFYYLAHILIIHLTAVVVSIMREGKMFTEWYSTAPYTQMPSEYRWSLPLLYLVFLLDIVLLYVCCRWYARYKFAHPEVKWLKYL